MARVKGTMLIEFVKNIRALGTDKFMAFLTNEDREIISQKILPSAWYPFETYKRCFTALVNVVAKGDMEMVRQWGQVYGEQIIKSVYKTLIVDEDPGLIFKKYRSLVKGFFDFGKFDMEEISEGEVLIKIIEFDPSFEAFYHVLRGWVEKSLEMSGAKEVKSEFVSKSWQGDPETSIKLSWSI